MTKLKETRESVIKLLYQLMYDVHQILVNNGIKYWIEAGTLLGAVRNTGIIPWDDDLDIGIMQKDVRKLKALEKHLKKCGYSLVKHWLGYKICYAKRPNIEGFDYSFPFLDVISYKEVKEKGKVILEPSLKTVRKTWPKEWFVKSEVFPLVEYDFGDFFVLGPKEHSQFLERMYGKDWNEIAYRQYDHELEEGLDDEVKVKLTRSMRKPAEPYDEITDRRCVKACLLPERGIPKIPNNMWLKSPTKSCARSGKCYHNFEIPMGVFVVNCSMHKARYEKFKKYAKQAGLEACRVPCVLGTKFNHGVMCKLIKNKIVSPRADMTTIEVSINMSHYNVWQRLVNSCYDYAMVLEDDIEVKSHFVDDVNDIMDSLIDKGMGDFSVLHLWNGNWAGSDEDHKKILTVKKGITVVQETSEYNAGAAAYIMSRTYAEYLMKKFFPIKLPQDIMMGEYPKKGKHLSLKMKHRKKDDCYLSPLLDMECGGAGGTGSQTTQEHSAPTIKERWSCDKC